MKFSCLCWFIAAFLLFVNSVSYGQTREQEKAKLETMSDRRLRKRIASADGQVANDAVLEIFSRGERSISGLIKLKGNKALYIGACLGDPNGADFVYTFIPPIRGSEVTTEVVALYLVSAIYYDNLGFANVPYLTGDPPAKDYNYNTPKRIRAAWKATVRWNTRRHKLGLTKLREKDDSPLGVKSKVWFTGSNKYREASTTLCVK